MTDTNPFSNAYPVTGWQLLGKLKVSRDVDAEATIHNWLMEILKSLNLHPDFFSKLTLSMQDAAMSLLKPSLEVQGFEHIHLLVLARRRQTTSLHSWGFFRIEKLEGHINENGPPDHTVEFYLYQE